MKRMFARPLLWICLGAFLICLACPAAMSSRIRSIDSPLIERFKVNLAGARWRDGRTNHLQCLKGGTVCPSNVGVAELGEDDFVFISWTRHQNNKSDEHYVVAWKVGLDGAIELASTYAKPMELGWHALALSLIASEVADGETNANVRFLHDLSNFDFVTTT
ncbi:hypothetical protein [Bradyrhizobium sp. Gha]|uniref:hypothetical protein n=1 Tax=Bradyrhizobium sp. Gha TaxID=1855318 RepID=UPI001FCD2D93|nr:hypothetical protein [Bradyrhizobium sp. Gha]